MRHGPGVVQREHRRAAHEGEITVTPRDLGEAPARALRRQRKARRRRHLVGLERRRERGQVELVGRNHALAALAPSHDRAVETEQERGQLGGGIGVNEAAHHGAAVPDRRVRHPAERLREERRVGGSPFLESALTHQRPDRQRAAGLRESVEVTAAVDVHERGRPRQA